jgi:all-trans-retinol 13,14-reductase
MKYDVVVIGGGLGGLVSAFILSKEGMKVCVLEQHYKAGGNLQTFTRDGCIFDTGMHYLGSLEEGQYLHRYFKYLELNDKLSLKKLDTDGYDTISFDGDGNEYGMSQGYDQFINSLLKHFPGEQKGLEAYTEKIRSVTDQFPLISIAGTDSYHLKPSLMEECAAAFIRSTIHDGRLQNILAGALSLYPGSAHTTPLYVHACIRDSLINSCWRPIDGSQQIADGLVSGIKKYGGEVLLSRRVKEIQVEDGLATGVLLEGGERVFGEKLISNVHPASTLQMIGESKIRKIYRRRIMRLKNTPGAFTVYAVLKKNTFPYHNKNYFHYANDGVLETPKGEHQWPDNYYFYTPASSRSGQYAESVVVMADMKYQEVQQWAGSKVNRRGEAYKTFKQQKAEALLKKLEERWPGIGSKIYKYYTSTPLTFMDFTATYEGSAYGVLKDCSDPMRSIILPVSKISNLYFTGQNLNLHGIMGVTAAAVITCSEIVGLRYLTNKIANG